MSEISTIERLKAAIEEKICRIDKIDYELERNESECEDLLLVKEAVQFEVLEVSLQLAKVTFEKAKLSRVVDNMNAEHESYMKIAADFEDEFTRRSRFYDQASEHVWRAAREVRVFDEYQADGRAAELETRLMGEEELGSYRSLNVELSLAKQTEKTELLHKCIYAAKKTLSQSCAQLEALEAVLQADNLQQIISGGNGNYTSNEYPNSCNNDDGYFNNNTNTTNNKRDYNVSINSGNTDSNRSCYKASKL